MIPFATELALRVWLSKHRLDFNVPMRIRMSGFRKSRMFTTGGILEIRKRVMYTRGGQPTDPVMRLMRKAERNHNGPRYVPSEIRQLQNTALEMLMGSDEAKPQPDEQRKE